MEEQNAQVVSGTKEASNLTISRLAMNYLFETGKWTKFLSILGFIFTGLIVLMGLFAGTLMSVLSAGQSDMMPAAMSFLFGGVYILFGLLYFFPAWYLFKFSKKIRLALLTSCSQELNEAFGNQKSFFKFWGVFMIVIISIYVLFGAFALLVGLAL